MSKLTTVIGNAIEDRIKDVHTCLPGRVITYYAVEQLADVELMVPVNRVQVPTLGKLPVCWPRTAQTMIHMPMAAGDFVIVLFTEEAIGTFRANQGVMAPTGDLRRHSLSGAYCLPGGYPDAKKLSITDPSKVTIKCSAGVVVEGDLKVQGALEVTGAITAGGEITAKYGSPAAVKLTTHTHPAPGGATSAPTPGS